MDNYGIQWLLIGGPGHGKVLRLKGGMTLRFCCESTGGVFGQAEYVARDFRIGRSIYRIGEHSPTPEQRAGIHSLIEETALEPFVR